MGILVLISLLWTIDEPVQPIYISATSTNCETIQISIDFFLTLVSPYQQVVQVKYFPENHLICSAILVALLWLAIGRFLTVFLLILFCRLKARAGAKDP